MSLFKQLDSLLAEGDTSNITVLKNKGKLILAISVTNKEKNHKWPPFTNTGTPEELEEGFYDSFDKALNVIKAGNQTLEDYAKQIQESAKSSEAGKKVEAKAKISETTAQTKAKKEAEDLTKKGDEFFTKKEYAKARYYYAQALDNAAKHKLDTKAIQSKIDLCNKLETPDLFGASTTTDTTNSVPATEESDKEQLEEPEEPFSDEPDSDTDEE